MEQKLRMAILDMNEGRPNQGMRCIRDIATMYSSAFDIDEFDVRSKNEIPGLEYDVYISSGGPGNPMEGDGVWDKAWYNLVGDLWQYNQNNQYEKKYMFFICHSFQMACHYFELGTLAPRKSTSFGVMPVHMTKYGESDPIFANLPDPLYAVDSRDFQLIQPDLDVFNHHGARILAMEKIRDHVDYERAIMAVRFSNEFVGTQFHPEADPVGMKIHFEKQEIRDKVIENFGQAKYDAMMEHIDDPDKIELTHDTILPLFIENALDSIFENNAILV
ncbi:MAG TPA: GMP synthase [Saprospiraceae bacterium]|nr:GMP synthase [Saprospiraceae bacterium]HMU02045.1 GMP synthase [Saprospiraceae bacterium]